MRAVRIQDTLAVVIDFVSSLISHNEKAHIYVRANSALYNEDGALTVSHPLLTYSDSPSLLVSELFIANDTLSNAEVCGAAESLQAHIELRL